LSELRLKAVVSRPNWASVTGMSSMIEPRIVVSVVRVR
jgi:hypothetical protein